MLLDRVAALTMRLLVSVFLLGGALAHESLRPPALDDLNDLLDQTVDRTYWAWAYGKYDRIAFCIQAVDGTINDARYAREQLRTAASAFVGPSRINGTIFKFPPLIDLGCPGAPARYIPRSAYQVFGGFLIQFDRMLNRATGCCQYGSLIHHREFHSIPGRRVAEQAGDPLPPPSPYSQHLHIVSARRQTPADRSPYWPRSNADTEEHWTANPHSDLIIEATSGRYLTREQFADVSGLEVMLEHHFRRERRVPLSPEPGTRRAVPAEVPKPALPSP